jgi:hypothetical protein
MLNPFMAVTGLVNQIGVAAIGLLLGAVGGAILGMIIGGRLPQKESSFYAEGIKAGTVLVAVETKNNRAVEALSMMRLSGTETRPVRRQAETRYGAQERYGTMELTTTSASESYPKLSG